MLETLEFRVTPDEYKRLEKPGLQIRDFRNARANNYIRGAKYHVPLLL